MSEEHAGATLLTRNPNQPGITAELQTRDNRENNIGLLRLLLATMVIVAHSYQLCGKLNIEPTVLLTRNQETGGSIAVNFFFLISGFLITKSWLLSTSATTYLRKRILRIYPGYLVAILVTIIISAICSRPTPLVYVVGLLRSNEALLRAALLLQFSGLDQPGAFRGNPYPNAANHPLWTLQQELFCYLLLAGIGVLGLLNNRRNVLIIAVFAYLGFAANLMRPHVDDNSLWRFITYFSWGAVFYLYRDRIRYAGKLVLISACALAAGCAVKPGLSLLLPVMGGYILFWAAFSEWTPLKRLVARGDISYGMYIYGWPIQQSCIFFMGILNPVLLIFVCVPLTALVATASWVFVERPFLSKKTPTPNGLSAN